MLYFITAVIAQSLVSHSPIVYSNAVNVIATACYLSVNLLFYHMFKAVNRRVSLIAAVLSVGGCGIQTLRLFHLASPNVSPFLCFGPYCILLGFLIVKSTFLPHFLGVLMAFAGLGWLIFLLPPAANVLSAYIKVLGVAAEAALMLWLLVMGVNAQRWQEQANAATFNGRT